jgi:hypothetical protein
MGECPGYYSTGPTPGRVPVAAAFLSLKKITTLSTVKFLRKPVNEPSVVAAIRKIS